MIVLQAVLWISFVCPIFAINLISSIPEVLYDDQDLVLRVNCTSTGLLQLSSNIQGHILSVPINSSGLQTLPSFTLIQAGHQISISLNNEQSNFTVLVVPRVLNIGFLISRYANEWMSLLVATIDFNNSTNRTLLPWTNISLQTAPSFCAVQTGAKGFYDLAVNQNVVAIVGPQCSSVALVVSIDAGAFEIPLVSSTAASATLSNKSLYPYFFRTTTSNAAESISLLAMVVYYGWKEIVCISIDAYPLPQDFYNFANANNIAIVVNIVLSTGDESFIVELESVRNSGYKIIIAYLYDGINGNNDMTNLVNQSSSIGLFDPEYVWLCGSSALSTFNNYVNDPKMMNQTTGMFFPSTQLGKGNLPLRQRLIDLWNSINLTALGYDELAAMGPEYPAWDSTDPNIDYGSSLFSLSVDGLYLILHALDTIIGSGQPLTGKLLRQVMRATVFEGISGLVHLDNNQENHITEIMWQLFYQNQNSYINSVGSVNLSMLYQQTDPFKWRTGSATVPPALYCRNGCGNGTCIKPDTCLCNDGYTRDAAVFSSSGPDCTRPICLQDCVYGTCVSPNNCSCEAHYIGDDCSIHSLPIFRINFANIPFTILQFINTVSMIFAGMTLMFTIFYRSAKKSKLNDTIMSCCICFGAILFNLAGYFRIIYNVPSCILYRSLIQLGCTILLTSLFLKNFKIYRIFSMTARMPSAVSKYLVYWIFAVSISIEIFLLLISFLVIPVEIGVLDTLVDDYFYIVCQSKNTNAEIAINALLATYKIIQLLCILVLEFKCQILPREYNKMDNDIRCSYILLFFGTIYVIFASIKMIGGENTEAIIFIALCICTSVGVILQFFHKELSHFYKNRNDTATLASGRTKFKTTNIQREKAENNEMGMIAQYRNAVPCYYLGPGLFSRWTKSAAVIDGRNIVSIISIENQSVVNICFFLYDKSNITLMSDKVEQGENNQGVVHLNIKSSKGLHQIMLRGEAKELQQWLKTFKAMVSEESQAPPVEVSQTLL